MNLIPKIKQFITKHNLIQQDDKIIIGLSGGPDSIFLLHFFLQVQKEYNLTLIAAHLNHEWRAEAHQDEQFCHSIAQKYAIPFITKKLSKLTTTFKYEGSKEEYARKMRRFFLEQVAHEYNAQHIALGHHAQDQQETFFIRLIRGTSLTGLTAMKPCHGLYIRPLLETNKKDILQWLHENNITYVIDISNESQNFLRNRIRKTVLPALRECDKRFDANFLVTLQKLTEDENFLTSMTQQIFATITTMSNNTYILDISSFFANPALQYRLIIHWLITEKVQFPTTQAFFDEIMRFLKSPRGGTHNIHKTWILIKKHNKAHIQRIAQ